MRKKRVSLGDGPSTLRIMRFKALPDIKATNFMPSHYTLFRSACEALIPDQEIMANTLAEFNRCRDRRQMRGDMAVKLLIAAVAVCHPDLTDKQAERVVQDRLRKLLKNTQGTAEKSAAPTARDLMRAARKEDVRRRRLSRV